MAYKAGKRYVVLAYVYDAELEDALNGLSGRGYAVVELWRNGVNGSGLETTTVVGEMEEPNDENP